MKAWRIPLWLELAAAVLLALIVSNAVTFAIAEYQRAAEIRTERQSSIESRLTALMSLLARLPESEHAALFKVASVRRERVSIGAVPRVSAIAERDAAAETKLKTALATIATGEVRVAKRGTPDIFPFMPKKRAGIERFSVAVALGPGRWLNAEFFWPEGANLLPGLLLSAGVASLALIIVAIWLAFRFSRPLQRLSLASARMAQGRAVEPIPETGPAVLKSAAHSFNAMSRRLMTMLDNQRTLLGSIAHDLRTPITSLKLKTEFIDDPSIRVGMQASLDELQAMTEAALDAARTGLGEEPLRNVDIAALVESVCADLTDIGGDIAFMPAQAANAPCRPNALKRAARNIIENAVKYGIRAKVSVTRTSSSVAIQVDDEGPGLPPSADRLFEPFVRGDTARGQCGLGLGLTLARAVARAHNGDLSLVNRAGGGVRATLTISPLAEAAE
ncbi:MAG: HAMP domain-containing protein [Alphaproteobacteria bacterium]|nr:HAMP domain-containing protein [Alphaproteobacteria bacterium]